MDMHDFSPPVRELWALANPCTLCPRQCRAERGKGQIGFCGIADMPVVSSIGPHFGEESVLVGRGGSGTIFLAGSFEIIDFLADQVSPSTTINVMDQYRPCYKAPAHPRINRRPTPKEIQSARKYALDKGLNVLP